MRRYLPAVGLALLLLPSPALALDLSEWVPGLRLSPFVSERTEYESNVFQTPSHSKDDVIFTTIPGILIDYGNKPFSLSAGYRAEILKFLDMSDQDKVHHIAVGQAKLDLTRLKALIRDDYTKTSIPPNSELTGPVDSTTNVLAPEAEYWFTERFALGAGGSWTRQDFGHAVNQLNRDEYLVGPSLFWKILPKADLRLMYNYGEKNFDRQSSFRDVTRHVGMVGLRGDLTSKLSSTFRLGYESREATHHNLKGYEGLVAGGDWVFKPSERTQISLITNRSVEESVFANALYYVATTATLVAEHYITPKLAINARAGGGVDQYPVKAELDGRDKWREDTLFGGGVGAHYDIQKWLRVGLDYTKTLRNSNFREFNFVDDKVGGNVTVQF